MMLIYRLLLGAYPAAFRAEFQGEMLQVLNAVWSDSRQKGPISRCRLALHEFVGLLLGLFREHKLNQEGPEESRISSFRAPIAVLVLYLLCTWTLKELGVHALFSPVSYLIAVCGTTFGLWIIGTRRVLNGRRKRTALSVVALLFWIGLPLVLKFSEAGFQAYLRNAPIEFIYEYPGVVLQSRIVTAPTASSPGLRVSEMVPLAGDRQLMLTEHHLPDAPPYKAILPVFLMSASFLWRRRNA